MGYFLLSGYLACRNQIVSYKSITAMVISQGIKKDTRPLAIGLVSNIQSCRGEGGLTTAGTLYTNLV